MAKDDYPVLVYKILSYLYEKLKRGERVEEHFLSPESPFLRIPESYWAYIILHLTEDGYITGPLTKRLWGDETVILGMERTQITPKGIQVRNTR